MRSSLHNFLTMLIQKIIGWLWNQMFQYAFIKALSLRNKVDFKLDISDYKTYFRPFELELFNIDKNYAEPREIPFYQRLDHKNKYISILLNSYIKPFCYLLNKHHYKEIWLKLRNDLSNIKTWYIDWFFQSEKYFKDFESDIRKDFTFSNKLSKKNLDLLKSLDWKNIVSVHIRRWDYLKHTNIYPICSLDYYNKAIWYIYDKIKNPIFLFFSDDSERVKKNFKWDNYYFVDWNTWKDCWQDMALMSKCKHNIIANSSFSWWWAWLNNNPDKIVIAPKLWSYKEPDNKNILPNNWTKI